MTGSELVLVCALSMLGRSEKSFPRIELVEIAPADASAGTEAFVDAGVIHVVTSSHAFRQATADVRDRCDGSMAIRKIASILAHEEWHIRRGPDEREAYYAQLTALSSLGIKQDSALYHQVKQSMAAALRARKTKRPEGLVASR